MIIGVFLLNFLIFIFGTYKKEERKKLDKKQHKLYLIYGLSMFIVDRLPSQILRNNLKVNQALGKLIVKEDIEREKYLYIVKKVAICIVVIEITLLLTIAVGFSEKMDNKSVDTITRSVNGDTEYSLQIEDKKGKKEQVTIHVAKKKYTKEQIGNIFRKRKDELIKKVLNQNKSLNRVNQSLNLVTSIGKEKIMVSWSISDSKKIDYDGELSENISSDGEIVILTATMTLEKTTQDYCFAVNVFPPIQKSNKENKLQEYVDKNQQYQDKVKLPEQIDGEKVKYQKVSSNISKFILPIGIVITILLFILKDTDLKKEVDKRDLQMKNDYPEIVSKILLYYGTGLSIKGVIEKIVKGYEEEKEHEKELFRYAYEELSMCFIKIKSGVSESVAINEYGERCRMHCYIKLAGLIEQNMRRGTKDLSLVLKAELKEAMNEKKNNILKNGGQISTKLLGPMVIMLVISIVIIMVPAFMSMGF